MKGHTRSVRDGREFPPPLEARHGAQFLRVAYRMPAERKTSAAGALAACVVALAALAWPAGASGARWVVKGHGWGHGVGMSQYGAYGLAEHGRGYRRILHHYYAHTRIGSAGDQTIRVLLSSGSDSVGFRKAERACGKRLRRRHSYRFEESGSDVTLRACAWTQDRELRRYRHSQRRGHDSDRRKRGLSRQAEGDRVGRPPARDQRRRAARGTQGGWCRTRCRPAGLGRPSVRRRSLRAPTSWPPPPKVVRRLRRHAEPGVRRQGFRDQEHQQGGRAHARKVVRYRKRIATTYFFSTSGGQTESVQFAFPARARRLSEKRQDPYDVASPYHRWRVRYSQSEMESRLSGLFSGRLRKIKVLERGDSPRIVRARVVGSRGSSRVSGPGLAGALGLRSTWARFLRDRARLAVRDRAGPGCRGRSGAFRSRRPRRR